MTWDEVYEREVRNFQDHGDIGEIWFGEDTVEKMIDWILDNIENKETPTIDLGCGNGHILLEMLNHGYTSLYGIDYSPTSIQLATQIAEAQEKSIHYATVDLLNPIAVSSYLASIQKSVDNADSSFMAFDLAIDKGTFDAISLASGACAPPPSSDDEEEEQRQEPIPPPTQESLASRDNLMKAYASAVHSLLSSEGILLITSCNWTEKELVDGFADSFAFYKRVRYPTFKFGGVEGQKVVTVAFKRK
ncbi:Methyltransferase-like protein 10 [Chytridiales sp. JEL 0842]|nr:Methyltransferase-like protein 10 [Chytridiales sp. JEL 0842]